MIYLVLVQKSKLYQIYGVAQELLLSQLVVEDSVENQSWTDL